MHTLLIIVWFRQDLRLTDHPALYEAAKNGTILPIYIVDENNAQTAKIGGASRWWLHHSLEALNKSLDNYLCVYQGDAKSILEEIIQRNKVDAIYWSDCFEPWRIKQDYAIKEYFTQRGIICRSFNSAVLREPWAQLKKDGTPYKIFTPFYKHCLTSFVPRQPLPQPTNMVFAKDTQQTLCINDLNLLPTTGWDKSFSTMWAIGAQAAQQRLTNFIENDLINYQVHRDFPAKNDTSHLSAYLHFGEISPNEVWYALQVNAIAQKQENQTAHFLRELYWREFAYYLLYHFPTLPTHPLQDKFAAFPWDNDLALLKRWQQGQTGYPIIDAGMRELWQTGFMHNRLRMITGSFLVKNLLLHWQHGAAWFGDCLVDADTASNYMNWQWVAGCGVDAAPYFRIFNPVTQSKKFDPQGAYIRHFVPELARLPDRYLHCPEEAPTAVLKEAGIQLGQDYPYPIVALSFSRERALAAFRSLP